MYKLRQSAIGTYEQCPKLCEIQFGSPQGVEAVGNDDPRFQNKYSQSGIALHEVMEEWGIKKLKGEQMSLEDMHNLLEDKFNKIDMKYYDNPEDFCNYKITMHDEIDWLYDTYCQTTPIAVEKSFEFDELAPGLPIVTGTIDRIEGNLQYKDIDLIDYKSGSHKKFTKKELSNNVQATLYALAFKRMYGFYPKHFIFVFPKFQREKIIKIDEDFINRGLTRVRSIWMKMAIGEFNPPLKPNKFWCANFCPLTKDDCPRKAHKRYMNNWDNVKYDRFVPETSQIELEGGE